MYSKNLLLNPHLSLPVLPFPGPLFFFKKDSLEIIGNVNPIFCDEMNNQTMKSKFPFLTDMNADCFGVLPQIICTCCTGCYN